MTTQLPARRGAAYTYTEVRELFLTPRSRENAELLAAAFGRTPEAIDFAWRWIDADVTRFPASAFNRLYRSIQQVRRELGDEAGGTGGSIVMEQPRASEPGTNVGAA